jgi:Holliday junction DNA helicase RuvB
MPIDPRRNNNNDNSTEVDHSLVKHGTDIYGQTGTTPGLVDFVGQERAKRQINLAIRSAKERNTRLDHTLLASGLAGIGKTTLAMHIAFEMGVGFVEASGRIDVDDVQRLLAPMKDGDVLFLDEVHTLGKGNSSAWILPLMQEGKLLTPSGPIEVANITVIAATTDAGKLSEAMLSRFPLKPRLGHYELEEAALITAQFANKMDLCLNYDECEQIAEAGSRNPRSIRNLVTVARDLYTVNGRIDMDELMDLTGVTADGLNEDMQSYLRALSSCTNMIASVNTLCAILGETGNIGHIEKDLVARGFVEIQPRGRRLTVAGLQRVKALAT